MTPFAAGNNGTSALPLGVWWSFWRWVPGPLSSAWVMGRSSGHAEFQAPLHVRPHFLPAAFLLADAAIHNVATTRREVLHPPSSTASCRLDRLLFHRLALAVSSTLAPAARPAFILHAVAAQTRCRDNPEFCPLLPRTAAHSEPRPKVRFSSILTPPSRYLPPMAVARPFSPGSVAWPASMTLHHLSSC